MQERFGLSKQQLLFLICTGMALLFLFAILVGYRVGKDMAIRDNASEARATTQDAQ